MISNDDYGSIHHPNILRSRYFFIEHRILPSLAMIPTIESRITIHIFHSAIVSNPGILPRYLALLAFFTANNSIIFGVPAVGSRHQ